MKVLITGGLGFLGSNLASFYLKRRDQVIVLDALFRKGAELNQQWLSEQAAPGQFVFCKLDLADAEAVRDVFIKHGPFELVCHVGGQVAMTTSLSDPRRDMLTNVLGTFNILEACRAHSPDAFLAYSSTNKVYGDLAHLQYQEKGLRFTAPEFPAGFDETLPLDFSTPYGCSKGAADQYVRDWSRVFGLQTVVFRHSSIYGGRQFATFDQGWVGWFCQQALLQNKARINGQTPPAFSIAGTGKQVRDVLYADDLVQLYHCAFENREKSSGRIFNIGGGMENSLSLLELFVLIEELLNLNEPLAYIATPRRASDQDFFVANIAAVHNAIGWRPKVNARSGVGRMIEWLAAVDPK